MNVYLVPGPLKSTFPSAFWLSSLSALEFCSEGADLPWPPINQIGCRPGEMKYVAFVQRDQVSGQTKKYCLSSVHLGKEPTGAGPFCEWAHYSPH